VSGDNFCYIRGKVTFSTQKRSLTPMVKKAYECYFGCKKWAPHVCCISCATILCEWLNNKGRSMPFALPTTWREPTDHLTDCYFCIFLLLRHGITKKKKRIVNYLSISSAIRQVHHTADLPAGPVPPQQYILDSDDEPTENWEKTPQPSTSTDADFIADLQFNELHRITQEELNDLIRDLNLPKSKAELLGSRLQQWNLLEENVRICLS